MAIVYDSPSPIPPDILPTEQDEEQREIAARAAARRLALSGDQQLLRQRYEEVMRWLNPPWDQISKRVDPRPEKATAERDGRPIFHVDKVGPAVQRWAVLEMGELFTFRCEPEYVAPPLFDADPNKEAVNRREYAIDRERVQNKSSKIENQTNEWIADGNLHRTLFWAAWAKRAFGVAILRDVWDDVDQMPATELLENPSQVYRGWTTRYGRRMLSWVNVCEAMSPEEAEFRYGLKFPRAADGTVLWASWTGGLETGEMDQRQEQQGSFGTMVWVEEYWELHREDPKTPVWSALIVAGRVIGEVQKYEWKRLPFHVIENEHIPTYEHGKSTAEQMIAINEAYDDMVDRQHTVIEFEAGPRYKGMNMGNTDDEVDVPGPFKMIPLKEGEDLLQLDTHVDFFPTQLHSQELQAAKYETTGLTPVAEGMSPNAQTSGRALTAEWRAVELPLFAAIINWEPELIDMFRTWWDFAELYNQTFETVGKGYRRFRLKWQPVDVRDATEKTLDLIQKFQNHWIGPETAMEMIGIENVDEEMAQIKAYLTDPIYNPLGYQQYLVLKQLAQNIQMQEIQLQALQGQAQQQGQGQQQGAPAPAQAGAQPNQQPPAPGEGPVTPAQNQPGQSPGGGGIPIDIGLLSRTPLENGSGNQVQATLPGGQPGIPIGPGG